MTPLPLRTRRALPATILAVALLASACAPPTASGPAPGGLSLDSLYALTIHDAAVYQAAHVLPLNAIRPDSLGEVRVVTYTGWGGYKAGTDTITRQIWVTQVPEVRDSCREFTGDLALRLQQLLGLPPRAGDTLMVEMTVPASALFRPTVSPAVTTRYPCGDTLQAGCGQRFPDGVAPDHVRWIADQTLTLWAEPGGYPWTRLGYTYNWHPGSPRYGASEYLVRANTVATGVQVSDFRAYCGRTG
jgi:hypothetical protein